MPFLRPIKLVLKSLSSMSTPTAFDPSPEELAFLRQTTRIEDEGELKAHVEAVQAQALAVHSYPCIKRFTFARLKIARLPAYRKALALLKERGEECLLLDIGCCFGADARKAVVDGFPATQVIASDLYPEFWDLGHQLFRDTQESMPITFIPGDVFSPTFLTTLPLSNRSLPSPLPPSTLSALTTLTPLNARLSAIHASNFFHLFTLEKQGELARRLAALLLPRKGSILFGSHIGAKVPGEYGRDHWAHSDGTWTQMWDGLLGKERCEVTAALYDAPAWVRGLGIGTHILVWSVELK